MEELKDLFGLEQVPQTMLTQVVKLNTVGKGATGELLNGLREQDLAAVACCEEA